MLPLLTEATTDEKHTLVQTNAIPCTSEDTNYSRKFRLKQQDIIINPDGEEGTEKSWMGRGHRVTDISYHWSKLWLFEIDAAAVMQHPVSFGIFRSVHLPCQQAEQTWHSDLPPSQAFPSGPVSWDRVYHRHQSTAFSPLLCHGSQPRKKKRQPMKVRKSEWLLRRKNKICERTRKQHAVCTHQQMSGTQTQNKSTLWHKMSLFVGALKKEERQINQKPEENS